MLQRACTAIAAAIGVAGACAAQANKLGDARKVVFEAFREADAFRRIVRDVDSRARKEVERRLPFKVHFNELGPHALYVALRKRKPVGLLYLRSEQAKWGITEIGWSLSLDLRVLGFWFQSSRSRHQKELRSSPFARQLVGSSYAELRELYVRDKPTREDVPEGARDLARTVLQSSMKTTLVLDAVWRDEIAKLRDLAMGFDAFPTALRFRRRVFTVGKKERPAGVTTVHVMHATGKSGSALGMVVRSESTLNKRRLTLRWILSEGFTIRRVVPSRPGPDLLLAKACRKLEGTSLLRAESAHRQLGQVAAELATLLWASPGGRR